MRVLMLGAGQEVGRSCVVVRMGRFTFMFDCGMHMGYKDARRFPDFGLLSPTQDYNSVIDAVFISHFHLDHVGALPYFTGVCGYRGPVFMTFPTRAIAPMMLSDYHGVLKERPGMGPMFDLHHVAACMDNARLLDLQETVQVCEGVQVTAYSAGHVLGGAVLHVQAAGESLVYTGDFNTVPDRHLPGASLPRLAPDLLITESTYATVVREGKRAKERQLLGLVHAAVSAGGKVLFPVSAVGRAQELLLLLEEYWERTQLTVPIYFSSTMGKQASKLYRLLINWASERVKQGALGTRAAAFGFGRVQPWHDDLLNQPGPCVLFATPGMLQGGTSLEVFKAWAPGEKNLVLLPSFQVAGTLGRRLLSRQQKAVAIDSRTKVDVNCKVHYVSFSAHADAKGILQLVEQLAPAAALLVHGEPDKMTFMCEQISRTRGIQCIMPAVGEELQLAGQDFMTVSTSAQLLRKLPLQLGQLGGLELQLQPGIGSVQAEQAAGRNVGGAGAAAAATGAGQQVAGPRMAAGAAAAHWLKQGDVSQLVSAAMQLAGLTRGQPAASAAAGAAGGSIQPACDMQQQPLLAKTRAAQLAPWLELLAAAAAQQTEQPNGHAEQNEQQQEAALAEAGGCSGGTSELRAAELRTAVAALSQQLQQQLMSDSQAAVIDGVLIVHHHSLQQQPQQAGNSAAAPLAALPSVPRMQLLPPAEAAAVLGVQQHVVRLSCRLKLPLRCWQHEQVQPQLVSAVMTAHVAAVAAAAAPSSPSSNITSGLSFVAEVLRTGLSSVLSQQVLLCAHTAGDEGSVRLRSFAVRPSNGSSDAGNDNQMVMLCSWQLHDDVLAEQCVSLLRLAAASAGNVFE